MKPNARWHIAEAVHRLEAEAEANRFNVLAIRNVAGAALLIGLPDLEERAAHLLRIAPDESFLTGVTANFDLREAIPRLRQVPPKENLERSHPAYSPERIRDRIQAYSQSNASLAILLSRNWSEAQAMADSGHPLENLGNALAALGDFDAALQVASDPRLEPFRQQGIHYVIAIEQARCGRHVEAESSLPKISEDQLDTWGHIDFALALAGREPWGGYPFSDW